jgi:hypothetical protein
MKRIRRQKPVKGGRARVNSGFIKDVEHAVNRECVRYGVSRSFVIATCCAYALGVSEQEDYQTTSHLKLVRRRKSA